MIHSDVPDLYQISVENLDGIVATATCLVRSSYYFKMVFSTWLLIFPNYNLFNYKTFIIFTKHLYI